MMGRGGRRQGNRAEDGRGVRLRGTEESGLRVGLGVWLGLGLRTGLGFAASGLGARVRVH